MRVQVRLFAQLRERAGADRVEVDLPEGARVADAIAALGPLAAGMPVVMAVNREYADGSVVLTAGDELALVPPVSGGAAAVVHARITAEAPSVDALLALVRDPRAGAVITFSGVTRDVERLEYEAYAEMAEPRLLAIAGEALQRHGLCAAAVEHRVGAVALGEASVVVAVSAPHRVEAFLGAREIIDRVKSEAPIWKREVEGDVATWVPGTPPPVG